MNDKKEAKARCDMASLKEILERGLPPAASFDDAKFHERAGTIIARAVAPSLFRRW